MNCPICGSIIADASNYCENCGHKKETAETVTIEKMREKEREFVYAGFWRRFCAAVIDILIIYVILSAIGFVFQIVVVTFMDTAGAEAFYNSAVISIVSPLIGVGFTWLYFAYQESRSNGATLGKKAIGIKVTDLMGNKIGFSRATLRFLGKILSTLLLGIGHIIIGFTKKKQALHDYVGKTLVIKVE